MYLKLSSVFSVIKIYSINKKAFKVYTSAITDWDHIIREKAKHKDIAIEGITFFVYL